MTRFVLLFWIISAGILFRISAIEIEKDDRPSTAQMRDVLLNGSLRGRQESAKRLVAQASPEAMAALFDGMADTYAAYLVTDAVIAKVNEKPAGFAALLLPGLKHSHWRARMFTSYALGRLADKSASADLAALLSDENRDVRLYAAQALRRAGDTNAVQPLIKTLKDPYGLVRLHAAAALGELKDMSAVPGLVEALNDANAAINAARSLGKIGGNTAETALLKMIRAQSPSVAWSAIEALGAFSKNPSTAQTLKTLAAETSDMRTKKSCLDAAAAINGRVGK